MADMPERIYANDANHWHPFPGEEGTAEYVRADIYAKELATLAIESKDRELALTKLEAEVFAIRSRIRFLEKALEQAVRMTAMRMYCIVGDEKNFMLSEKRHCIHRDDYPELAQYLQEKKEG